MRNVTLLSMKNKSVQNCRFVHHAKFHCIMTTLNKLFKFRRKGGGGLGGCKGGGGWADVGGGVGRTLFSSRTRPPHQPKGPPFDIIL